MGLIEKFRNKRVFLDTAPLICYIEERKGSIEILDPLFNLNISGYTEFITSTLTLLEVLVLPIRLKRQDLVDQYEMILTQSDSIHIIELNLGISRLAAEIRAEYNYKTPDSIQLATAINSNSDYFLTNDKKLKHSNLKIITPDDLKHY
ncbi:MAG: PIN domain-containing protein [Bacteroidales bacterium]|nr:PIN domain-containing protein [Bacteroidales bacterium]